MDMPLPREVVAEDRCAWFTFFASVVAMEHHPRNKVPMPLDECAQIADRMLQLYMRRFPWPGSAPSSGA